MDAAAENKAVKQVTYKILQTSPFTSFTVCSSSGNSRKEALWFDKPHMYGFQCAYCEAGTQSFLNPLKEKAFGYSDHAVGTLLMCVSS